MSALLLAGTAVAGPRCIEGHDVLSTARPDDHTLIFNMRGHTAWRSALAVACPGLHASVDGFSYKPTDPLTEQLCAGLTVIKLNDVGHASCILGPFSRTAVTPQN